MKANGSKDVTLGDRLTNYASLLKQLDVVISELETVGFVTIADRDRWEKLIIPERLRISVAMKSLGISALSQVPSLDAVKAAPGSPVPSATANYHTKAKAARA